ncbi:MAG: 2-oxoacid:acceptor oxidoreductase subunit alpha [Anaerolineales bacterium]
MVMIDLTFRIGGEAGQGVESGGAGFAKALTRGGYHVVGTPDYYERIRGGHNFFTIRASDEPVYAIDDEVDVLIAMDSESLVRHADKLSAKGAVVVDEATKIPEGALDGYSGTVARLPLLQIAIDNGAAVMVNTAALAAAAQLVGLDLQHVVGVITENFGRKGGAVAEANRQVAQQAARLAAERYGQVIRPGLADRPSEAQAVLDCNRAFAMGAIMAGCKFAAGYPMTPWTSVLEYLAGHADAYGLVVKHAEDEIGAVNMAVGAAHAGVRAMTGSSGGGFDLMVEGLSLAAAIEVPLVVYLAQRPGPATGLSTRTAQADLLMAIYSSHGEWPRIVLAPHTPEEHFQAALRAFNLAERYQSLVIVLSDEYSSTTVMSRPASLFAFEQVTIDRGKLLTRAEVETLGQPYLRFQMTADGVSPRLPPGNGPQSVYLASSNLHTEKGHITEDPQVAVQAADKRRLKGEGMQREMRAPYRYGPAEAELTLITWGSSYGAAREAMEQINAQGGSANLVQFVDLWPLPVDAVREALSATKRLVCIETNATGQFAHLLRAETGLRAESLLRYDGRPLTAGYILAHLEA